MGDEPHIEGTAVEVGTEVVPAQQQPTPGLFHTTDPVEVVERATRVANALQGVLQQRGLTKRIQNKDHVLVEGWATLGAMVGVFPVVAWTRKLDNGWEARVEARTMAGQVIGAAEAECLRTERRWKDADDYAVRSMAQTRATSKALRGPLGFIVTLAGYVATPAEEMPDSPRHDTPAPGRVDQGQTNRLGEAFKRAGRPVERLMAEMDAAGCPAAEDLPSRIQKLSGQQAEVLIAEVTRWAREEKAA